MSFICVICRDLLKITEDEASSPRHQQQLLLPNNNHSTTNHALTTPTNNVSGRRREKNNSIVATKCGHLYHYPCLSAWLSQSMNLTSDSKMRCPSCKQLIYIYELIQLFPVESGGGCAKDLDHLFSVAFQQKLTAMLEHLETLCRDTGRKNNELSSPLKGNETPTKLQRIRDSPKKSQLAQLMKDMDSLRGSIKELNSFIEQHAELGSVVEKQTKEISELRSKNEQLILANERLKSVGNEEEALDKAEATIDSTSTSDNKADSQQKHEQNDDNQKTQAHENFTRTAQECGENSKEGNLATLPPSQTPNITVSTPTLINCRRKSVTFLDPFVEFDGKDSATRSSKTTIPFETKDFRVGDKVVWNFEGNLEVGTVKWKGFIGSQINVGVEFERQLGLPIKDLSSDALQCIFKFKPGHGRLIPVQEILLYSKENFKSHSVGNSSYPLEECVGSATKTSNGLNKRIHLCTHQ